MSMFDPLCVDCDEDFALGQPPVPTSPTPCPPSLPVTSAGWCDAATREPLVVIYQVPCVAGVPGAPVVLGIFNAATGAPVPGAVPVPCASEIGDWDHELICDTDPTTGTIYGVYSWVLAVDTSGPVPVFNWSAVTPGTGAPYVPQGEPRFCDNNQPEVRSVKICALVDRGGPDPVNEEIIAHYQDVGAGTTVYFTDLDGTVIASGLVTPTACCSTSTSVEWVCEEVSPGVTRTLEAVKVVSQVGDIINIRYFLVNGAEVTPTGTITAGICSQPQLQDAEKICAIVNRAGVPTNEEIIAHYSGAFPAIVVNYTDLDGTVIPSADVTPVACCSSTVAVEWVCWDNGTTLQSLEAVKVVQSNGTISAILYYTIDGVPVATPPSAQLSAGPCSRCLSEATLGVITDFNLLRN